MTADFPRLQVRGLHFAHPDRPLWAGWSSTWAPGTGLVLGGDGAGKSTLLQLLAGRLRPQRGQIALQRAAAEAAVTAPGAAYDAQVFWIDPRQPALPAQDGLTPAQWLATLPARHPRWDETALQTHVHGWALAPHLGKPFFALSTGTQRKVFMAAALASGAPLTLIDEPIGGLDKPSVTYLAQALDALADAPDRIVLVAHYEALPGVRWRSTVQLAD